MIHLVAIFLTALFPILLGNRSCDVSSAPSGASDQITDLASGGITATPQRDGAGRITGYLWSDGGNTVTQTWQRGPGGRIEFAGSNVPSAPSFDYLIDPQTPLESYDIFGRRLKCQTAGGAWEYVYGAGGQLASATHPVLGTFNYQFDGIGRRTDKGTANTSDILNRTIAWAHDQSKTLTITAHPAARVWFNGVEIPNFTGQHQAALTPPGTEGGWVPWETLAILEGAGEGAGNPPANPLASPDAKAEKRGAVWVPPTAETLAYDIAGNRQSSAQWDFGWDAQNRLARVRTKNHTTAPQAYDLTFTYDSEGRRVKKHVVEYHNGAVFAEKTVTFVWDGWDLLYERHQLPSGETILERRYLWGPDIANGAAGGAGGLLLIRETKGTTTTEIIPLYDGTGHVIALTDINKNLLASYAYGPFGEKISATGTHAESNPWRYATKYLDEETGLYYFGFRYYDTTTGQWLSREPLGESESVNLYSYCHNDPVNKVDVLGLATVAVDDQTEVYGPARVLINSASLFDGFFDDIRSPSEKFASSVTIGDVVEQSPILQGYLESRYRNARWDGALDIDYDHLEKLIVRETVGYAKSHGFTGSVQSHAESLASGFVTEFIANQENFVADNQRIALQRSAAERQRRSTLAFKINDLIAASGQAAVIVTESVYSELLSKPLGGASYTFSGGYQDISGGERAWSSVGFATLPVMFARPVTVGRGAGGAVVGRSSNRLATNADEAVFWSGIGRGGDKKALAWINNNGGATLESTLASRGIKLPAWNASDPSVIAAWQKASVDFANGAKRHVRVLQGDALRVDAIFGAEFRALQANPSVKLVISINPETGAEMLLWSR